MLGEILKNATGMDINEFSGKYLFHPLGVDSVGWYQYNNGVYATDGSLYMTSRDMLKFGVTYLNNGFWNDEMILPESWIVKSAEVYNNNKYINIPIEDSGENSYGYLWWISQLDFNGTETKMYRANGWGGQTIMVFPGLDMVVVFPSGNYASRSKLFKIIEHYVMPAIR
jgi:CubicO group peptidase (beta-lactamase class C family)